MPRQGLALLLLLLLAALQGPHGKPISLTYRCPCRYFETHVAKSQIRHLKILTVPGCPLQVIARLKNSTKQICIDPKLKWIQEYLEKYFQNRDQRRFFSRPNGKESQDVSEEQRWLRDASP